VSAQLGYGDLSGTPTIPTSFAWNVEGNATGPLSLSNAGYTSTFNQTSAVAWLWANTTTATVSTTNASPLLELAANCWHGGASTQDLWTIGSSLVAGTDGESTLTFGHTGSSGLANVSVPSLQLPVNSVAPSTAQAVYLTQDGTYVTLWTGRNTFRIVNQVDNTTTPSLFIIPGQGGTASNCNIVSGDTGGKLIIGGNSNYTNSFTPNSEYMDLGGNSVAFKGTTNGGTQININESSTFSPASGSSAYVAHYVNPTINQTSSASGSYTALKIAVIETSVLGTANKLIDCYAGSSGTTPEFSVSSAGTVALAGTLTFGSSADTGISRLGAASLAVGNGTAGDYSGSLKCAVCINKGFTVALLPSTAATGMVEGAVAYATNGLKVGETTGSGTGVPVYYSNGYWRVYSTDLAVAA